MSPLAKSPKIEALWGKGPCTESCCFPQVALMKTWKVLEVSAERSKPIGKKISKLLDVHGTGHWRQKWAERKRIFSLEISIDFQYLKHLFQQPAGRCSSALPWAINLPEDVGREAMHMFFQGERVACFMKVLCKQETGIQKASAKVLTKEVVLSSSGDFIVGLSKVGVTPEIWGGHGWTYAVVAIEFWWYHIFGQSDKSMWGFPESSGVPNNGWFVRGNPNLTYGWWLGVPPI